MSKASIMWFRQDLRQDDNHAFYEAVKQSEKLLCVYIYAPGELKEGALGAASKVWLHHSLKVFQEALAEKSIELHLFESESTLGTLKKLCKEHNIEKVFWNRLYEPAIVERDKKIKAELKGAGIQAESFGGHLLWEPWDVKNKSGHPYLVYTPFWRECMRSHSLRELKAAPKLSTIKSFKVPCDRLDDLALLPSREWKDSMMESWHVGEEQVRKRTKSFISKHLKDYSELRNHPNVDGTSQISMALHFGELSVRRVWDWVESSKAPAPACEVFLKELTWREFAQHLLFHFPHMPKRPLKSEFAKFSWSKNKKYLQAWQKGMTGYPIVDAGMRQLWQTGWMHNRVRMIVASFLIKDLFLSWQQGERWFWDTLVDADLASNSMGWQWCAGSGADAAPFFRIFNPTLQGERFDSQGEYVRRWVPELSKLPKKWIHKPWLADKKILEKINLSLGKDYPLPIVDHSAAREKALSEYKNLSKK